MGFWRGALFYLVCNLISFIPLSKYIVSCISILLERDPGKKFLAITYAVLFPILSLIGFAGWWGSSPNVKYDGDCELKDMNESLADGDRWELCAGTGATLSIFAFTFMLIAGVVAIVNAIK